MKNRLAAIMALFLLVILVFPSAALAYDYGGSNYNDNDYGKLKAFLNQMSDDGVNTNGWRLNPAYNQEDPSTWGYHETAVIWTSGTDKRVLQLPWSSCHLAGSLDISGFTSLTHAGLRDNSLTSVDVSGDTAIVHLDVRATDITELNASGLTGLQTLYCSDIGWTCDRLSSLNVSGCTALTYIAAVDSVISTLDVSGCTSLETLNIDNNKIGTLDVSDCTSLRSLFVSYNNLGSLDVSKCTSLNDLNCEGNVHLASLTIKGASGLKQVTCTGCALTALDASGLTNLTNLNCGVNDIVTLNVTGDTALAELVCDTNELEHLSVAGMSNLEMLNCADNNITEIEGLSDAANLGMLACSYNAIEALDVSGMASLVYLVCDHNRMTSLTGSGNTALAALLCSDNLLTSLDFSDSTNLSILAERNRLSSIKVVFEGIPVTVTAKGGGYVELYKDMDYHDYYINAVPCTGESFLGWTDASKTTVSAAAKYDLSEGTAYNIIANFTALELESSEADGTIYTGGRITLTPNHTGGTWSFDASYLSQDGNVFTALKAGKTRVQYTWGDETVAFEVIIEASELPATGQNMAWVWLLIGTAAAALVAGIFTRYRLTAQK